MGAAQTLLGKKTIWTLNAAILAAFAGIAVFSRPWAAFAAFLLLAALIGAIRAGVRIRYRRLGGGAAVVALLTPPFLVGLAYGAVFVSIFFVGDYWKPLALLVCAYAVYASLLLPWRKTGV